MIQPIPDPVVSVENLTHIYQQGTALEKVALMDVSLQIASGEMVGIVGENGSGKTTLAQHLAGLLRPFSGQVRIDGLNISCSGVSRAELRKKVGLVFQYPEHQLFADTVFHEISFGLLQEKTLSAAEITRRVQSSCASVGLDYEKFHRRSPFGLSSGEMRRVALASVLAQGANLLVFDEPTIGLDAEGKKDILGEIKSLHQAGKTVVIVSHGIEDLPDLVDRLIVLEEGRILMAGSPAEVFSFLLQSGKPNSFVPSIFRLCQELQSGGGGNIPGRIFRVEEAVSYIDQLLGNGSARAGKAAEPGN